MQTRPCTESCSRKNVFHKEWASVLMMIILSSEYVDVQCYTCCYRERVEYVWEHLCRKVSNLFALELEVCNAVRSTRDVNDSSRECLFRRNQVYKSPVR